MRIQQPPITGTKSDSWLQRLSEQLLNMGWIDARDFGIIGDGVVDNTVLLNDMFSDADAGSVIYIPPASSYYKITDTLTIAKAFTIIGAGEQSEIRQTTSNKGLFTITGSDVTIRDLKLYGPQYAASQSNERAIKAYGADKDNYISNLRIKDCIIQNWGMYGIHQQFVEDFEVEDNRIENIYYGACTISSGRRGNITGNKINNVIATPNAYGISLTRVTTDTEAVYPRTTDVEVSGNSVRNVTNWNGIGTHCGKRISICNNQIYGCKLGIDVTYCNDASSDPVYAPKDVNVVGNEIDSGSTLGNKSYGITFAGAYDSTHSTEKEHATGCIVGNTVRGHGNEDAERACAIYLTNTQGLVISGNTIIEPAPTGIFMNIRNRGFSITGNTIVDVWSDTYTARAVWFYQLNQTGYIGGNSFSKDTLGNHTAAAHLNDNGIRIDNRAGMTIELGANYHDVTTYLVDSGQKAQVEFASHLKLKITDTNGGTEGEIWYDKSEDKLKFKTAAGVETITSV